MDLARWTYALLVWCLLGTGAAQADPVAVLYRCVAGGEAPRWQDAPCPPGQEQRTLAYLPEPGEAAAHAPKPAVKAAPLRGGTPTPSRTRARGPDRAQTACTQARTLARLRTEDGRRVPVRTIRAREAEARKACSR